MQKKKIVVLVCVVVLICVVGAIGIVMVRGNGDTLASSVEDVDVVENLEAEESSVEVPSSDVLEDIGGEVNFDRGESKGEVVLDDVVTNNNSETEITETNGQLENTEVVEQYAEGTYYYTEKEDGSREYSPYLITDCMGTEAFAGLTEEQIKLVLDVSLGKYDTTDKEIRETIKYISRDDVRLLLKLEGIIIDAETPNTSGNSNTGTPNNQTGTTNNQTGTTTGTPEVSGGTTTPSPEVQPSTPSTPSVQPTTPQPTVDNNGLINGYYTPEEWAALQPATGGVSGATGESWVGADGR